MTRFVRWSLAVVVSRSAGIRTSLVVPPIFLLGGTLSAYGLVTIYVSPHRLLGLVAFSPFVLVGGPLICSGFASVIALRRSDRTVGSYFEERARDRR